MSNRREFITLLGSAAVAPSMLWPLSGRAQELSGKVPRIGFLQRIRNENVVAFIQGLRDAGYTDGQNVLIETRIFETTLDRLPDLANELVNLKCNVIVAASRYAFEAAMRATGTIPIVGIDLESDPVLAVLAVTLRDCFSICLSLVANRLNSSKKPCRRFPISGSFGIPSSAKSSFVPRRPPQGRRESRCTPCRSRAQTISKLPSTVQPANGPSMAW